MELINTSGITLIALDGPKLRGIQGFIGFRVVRGLASSHNQKGPRILVSMAHMFPHIWASFLLAPFCRNFLKPKHKTYISL